MQVAYEQAPEDGDPGREDPRNAGVRHGTSYAVGRHMQLPTPVRVAVLAAAIALAATSVAITPASRSAGIADVENPSDAVRHVSPWEAAETDLRLVAEARGWTIEEARHDRETADGLGDLQEVFIADHDDAYAGSYLSDSPTLPPTFQFVGEVPAGAQRAIDESGLEPNTETNARFTLAQLRASTIHAIETPGRKWNRGGHRGS